MSITKLLYLEVYATLFCILGVLLWQTARGNEKGNVQSRIFISIISVVMLTIVIETTAWLLDGATGGSTHRLLSLTDTLDNLFVPAPALLWLCYVIYHIFRNRTMVRRLGAAGGLLFAGTAFLMFWPRTAPFFFTLNQQSRYQRGPWLPGYMIVSVGVLLLTDVLILLSRRRMPQREFTPLLWFSLPAFIGPLLQVRFYGLSTVQIGITISLLLIYADLQSQLRSTDYLTGLANRRELDARVEHIFSNPAPRHTTALIMMDMDHLKMINDNWGHTMGDRAIEQCAGILSRCFHHNDLVARFAGDEFVAVLELEKSSDIQSVMDRLNATVRHWGGGEKAPFTVRLSAGYALYPEEGARTPLELYHQADRRMYMVKNARYGKRPALKIAGR